MENKFNNRDFEELIRQNADQYRMFPSEKVWNGIHNTLHTRRRWYGIGLGLLLLTTGVVTWVMLNTTGNNHQIVDTLPDPTFTPAIQKESRNTPPVHEASIIKQKETRTSFIAPASNLENNLYLFDNADPFVDAVVAETELIAANDVEPAITIAPLALAKAATQTPVANNIRSNTSPARTVNSIQPLVMPSLTPVVPISVVSDKPVYDDNFVDQQQKVNNLSIAAGTPARQDIYPLTIESVTNSFRIGHRRKAHIQFYVTPTISYRDLGENKGFIKAARRQAAAQAGGSTPASSPVYSYSEDVNSAVTHKPDAGLQIGLSLGYNVAKRLRVIGGLQFNVSKYDIRAYSHPVELTTIALSNPNGRTNTLYTFTNYRNDGGSSTNWLHNLYFSASAPIGLEYRLTGNRKRQVGIAGTVQPSFIISNRSYLLSTDYKNYAEMPSLIRKWNINTGFEIYTGFNTGKVNWRLAPQVRYQVMSSFIKKYPVQEHLFDFGLKLGVMLR